MKKSTLIKSIYLMLTAQMFVFISYAQTPYTYADGMWTIGDSVSYHVTNWTSAGPSGASQVWNFSSLPDLGLTIDSIETPLATPYGSNYPGAQLAQGNITGWGYYVQSSSGLWSKGSANANQFVYFSDDWQYRQYPMTYLSNWTDSFSGSGISFGNNFTSSGTCLDTVDGWGTLILPNATYTNNVLRLHSTARYTEIYTVDIHQHFWETYEWFIPGRNRAVLGIHKNIDTLNGTQVTQGTYAAYLDTIYATTSVYNVDSSTPLIALMPNPANNSVNISIRSVDLNKDAIFIYMRDITGRTIATEKLKLNSGSATRQFDISKFVSGVYFFEITDGTYHLFKKLIIE